MAIEKKKIKSLKKSSILFSSIQKKTNLKSYFIFIENLDVPFETHLLGRQFENEWLKIEPNGLFIIKGTHKAGYAWDGCTPKFVILDLLLGIPDGRLHYHSKHTSYKPITYYASMLHDILYQYKKHVPVTRSETDLLFYKNLKSTRFKLSFIYYLAVRFFGPLYGRWTNK